MQRASPAQHTVYSQPTLTSTSSLTHTRDDEEEIEDEDDDGDEDVAQAVAAECPSSLTTRRSKRGVDVTDTSEPPEKKLELTSGRPRFNASQAAWSRAARRPRLTKLDEPRAAG